MNAAFLLVTSACLAGQAAVTQPGAPPPAAPVVASACGPNCNTGCSDPCGADGFGHRLRAKMHGLFQRDCRDNCQATTCCQTPAKVHTPIFHSNQCNDPCKPKLWNWQPICRTHNTCAPANTCSDPCNQGGLNLLGRLRGLFQRGDRHCHGGCDNGCTTGCTGNGCAPAAAPVKTEKIDTAPKKMPAAPTKEPAVPKQSVENSQPAFPPIVTPPTAAPTIPVSPSVEITPVPSNPIVPTPAPRVDGERRDPF